MRPQPEQQARKPQAAKVTRLGVADNHKFHYYTQAKLLTSKLNSARPINRKRTHNLTALVALDHNHNHSGAAARAEHIALDHKLDDCEHNYYILINYHNNYAIAHNNND